MSMTDPIADLLTRIRNAVSARHDSCLVPASMEKENILKILSEEGFIKGYVRQEAKPRDQLTVFLKYLGRERRPVLRELRRVSKPGRRVYCGYGDIRPVFGGLGVAVMSTPLGIIADKKAREKKIGGEILCEAW